MIVTAHVAEIASDRNVSRKRCFLFFVFLIFDQVYFSYIGIPEFLGLVDFIDYQNLIRSYA